MHACARQMNRSQSGLFSLLFIRPVVSYPLCSYPAFCTLHFLLLYRLYDTPNTCDKKASFNSFLNDECFGNSGGKGLSYQFPQVGK